MKRKDLNSRQWQHVREARAMLEKSDDYPVLSEFEEAWKLLSSQYQVVERNVESLADTPLAAFMYHVELGFYPPPELMLGLFYAWRDYVEGGGVVSLEEAFFGKPVRKAGNYARRKTGQMKSMILAIEHFNLVRDGMTKLQAAEALVERFHLRLDAESLVRALRTRGHLRAGRKNKAIKNPVKLGK